MRVYTIEDIAKELNKNKLTIRHWIIWDEQNINQLLPKPFKIIGNFKKTRLYDEDSLQKFKDFNKYIKEHPGVMAEYNKKHFWKK